MDIQHGSINGGIGTTLAERDPKLTRESCESVAPSVLSVCGLLNKISWRTDADAGSRRNGGRKTHFFDLLVVSVASVQRWKMTFFRWGGRNRKRGILDTGMAIGGFLAVVVAPGRRQVKRMLEARGT